MFGRRRRRGTESFEISINDLDSPVTVRKSPRARRYTLSVNEAKRAGILTMPAHASTSEAEAFLLRNFDWLRDRLQSMPEAIPFADGVTMPLRGEDHRIGFVGMVSRHGTVWTEAGQRGGRICVAGDERHAPRRLRDWLKREARKDLVDRTGWHAKNLGVTPKRVTVRDQTTRWGSCSASGVLSYSWRVILAPPVVLDYLAAHEVAHLKEMNHSDRFWALVRETMPNMDEGKGWLKKHGNSLYRYGAES